MEIIEFNNQKYPKFQSEGFAAQFAFPYALKVCKGIGYDIGCNRLEWALPGAIPIDPTINKYDALNLPYDNMDYIFSSHCLEHVANWVDALDYWTKMLKTGGILFLYLPHYSQHYWRPWHNRKHVHSFWPHVLEDYLQDHGYANIFKSSIDLNNSFMIYGQKGNKNIAPPTPCGMQTNKIEQP